jgi:hypothetical protein
MNGRSQIQGGKNWIFLAGNLENHFCPSMGPNGSSVAKGGLSCHLCLLRLALESAGTRAASNSRGGGVGG